MLKAVVPQDLRRGVKVSTTQLVSTSMVAESVNSELSSMLPGMAFMQTMCAVDGFTTNLCLTLLACACIHYRMYVELPHTTHAQTKDDEKRM